MYNLQMHMHGDLSGYPWRWIMYWSKLLEKDLMQRRQEAKQAADRAARRAALQRGRR